MAGNLSGIFSLLLPLCLPLQLSGYTPNALSFFPVPDDDNDDDGSNDDDGNNDDGSNDDDDYDVADVPKSGSMQMVAAFS